MLTAGISSPEPGASEEKPEAEQRAPPRLWVTVAVPVAVVAAVITLGSTPALGEHAATAIALILMGASWSEFGRRGTAPHWKATALSALDGVAAGAIILPLFVLALDVWAAARGMRVEWRSEWPPGEMGKLLAWLLVLAAAEEMFFRGWLQARLTRHRPPRRVLLGARVGWNIPLAAAAFALGHVGIQGAAGLLVFFPGLVFGWLWERRRSLVGPVVFHALSNALVLVLITNFTRLMGVYRS